MFRDATQSASCCRALLAQVNLSSLWSLDGPTPRALSLLDVRGGLLATPERVMLLVAFTFWDRRGGLLLTQILDALDAARATAVCSLLVAVKGGHDDVDDWLSEYGIDRERRAHR